MNISAERMQEGSPAVAAITWGSTTHGKGCTWEKLGTVKSGSPVRRQKIDILFGSTLPSSFTSTDGAGCKWGGLSLTSFLICADIEFLVRDSQI